MDEFQNKLIKKKLATEKINLKNCTWMEVMQEIDKITNYYKVERTKGAVGSIRNVIRKLQDNAKDFQPWINLLPSGDYGSVLSGT